MQKTFHYIQGHIILSSIERGTWCYLGVPVATNVACKEIVLEISVLEKLFYEISNASVINYMHILKDH